jgi:KUP system potassium uptake protein
MNTSAQNNTQEANLSTLVLGAIGVVFGDIGTSPLYTLKSVFGATHAPPVNEASILGVLSIIFWGFVFVVSLKYIFFVMRADNHGEGGVIALTALALRRFHKDQKQYLIIMSLGMVGAGLFYGDSVITPAISVLSAVEGLTVAQPHLQFFVIPLTILIIILLFYFQHKGTGFIGQFFGPIMVVWFCTIAVLGIMSISTNPIVLKALNPYYAMEFLTTNRFIGFLTLGATFLALTGVEALYADMGHFGLKPIRVAWFWFIFPALVLNYFGQGALLMKSPEAIQQPFYLLSPSWMLYPLIILATAATIIASQAVISGTFSMTQAAIRLGYFPSLVIRYTSEEKMGQIYVPAINGLLFVVIVAVVLMFKSSDNLASAYGLSVTGTMVITTILAFGVIPHLWKVSLWKLAPIFGFFLLIDVSFLGANSIKFLDGGWLPIFIASIIFILMTTWRKGAKLLRKQMLEHSVTYNNFLAEVKEHPPLRIPGTGIYMTANAATVPPALYSNFQRNKVLHERVVILEVDIEGVPHIPDDERVVITEAEGSDLFILLVRYGFKDDINIPKALSQVKDFTFQIDQTTFFIGDIQLMSGKGTKMAKWRKRLFISMFKNSNNFIDYCKIPPKYIMEMGASVDL